VVVAPPPVPTAAELERIVAALRTAPPSVQGPPWTGPTFPPEATGPLAEYLGLLLAANASTNLTAPGSPAEVAEVALVDALVLAAMVGSGWEGSFVDVGTGGGAPGVPLALVLPGARGTLVEPRRRRWAFLVEVVEALGLGDRVQVVKGKVDPTRPTGGPLAGRTFDLAVARATFPPPVWLGVGARLAPRVAAFLTGPPPERPDLPVEARVDYALPESGARRVLTIHRRS